MIDSNHPICPHSGEPLTTVLDGNYFQSADGVIFYGKAKSADYGPDYFLEEYSKQYGKTYLEDEENIRKMAKRRLTYIMAVKPPPARLFEIGCAAGFFLDEARNAGYEVSGAEISPYAANHAANVLGLPVSTESFRLDSPQQNAFDIVCAFYVIEHFPDQAAVFRAISKMLRPTGIFSFALPSTYGPTLRYDPDKWISTHPMDHFADYSPQSLRKVLPRYKMKLIKTWPASYHPERARGLLRIEPVFKIYADMKSFGDTMEGLAEKEKL